MSDNWKHHSGGMRCDTRMYFVPKYPSRKNEDEPIGYKLGRCRRNAPTMSGWPVMFITDWCGQHKLDENKV